MSTRKRLGKGLGALLGESAAEAARSSGAGAGEIEVGRIVPNRFQPRRTFDDAAMGELAASIVQVGVLQPILVRPNENGDYEIVSGERRWRAARRAGLAQIPAVVRDVDERELLGMALIENLQREDLDPIEEATGYRRLIDEFELTQTEVAQHVGRSRPALSNAIRLLDLPDEVQNLVRQAELSAGHGRALLGLADGGRIPGLAQETVRSSLSVRQLERRVRRENGVRTTAGATRRTPADLERERIEEDLRRALGTRVTIRTGRKGKGKIEIAFYSFDDLDRIVEHLGVASR